MNKTKLLTLSSMFLALGIIMPQAFHTIPNAGNIFLPMHIPVLLCGFICGPLYGLIVGILTPTISHLIFSMPTSMILSQMIIELGIYGFSSGLLCNLIRIQNELIKNYFVLVLSMLLGRFIYGIANALIFKVGSYSFSLWISVAFVTSIPGILIQLILVPFLVKTLNKLLR